MQSTEEWETLDSAHRIAFFPSFFFSPSRICTDQLIFPAVTGYQVVGFLVPSRTLFLFPDEYEYRVHRNSALFKAVEGREDSGQS